MKQRAILIGGGIVIVLLFASYSLSRRAEPHTTSGYPAKCSNKPPLEELQTSDSHLKRLEAYQKECRSFVTGTLMFFTGFPEDTSAASREAEVLSDRLKRFKRTDVTPLVIAEPHTASAPVSYASYLAGDYDTAFARFFSELKARGVTDEMMGTWVPFPESNTPLWDNQKTTPQDFARCVNKYLGTMKRYFPTAKGSVLLNSMTYAPDDTGWQRGEYADFSEYVGGLDPNLVTSFGVQGFPWTARASEPAATVDDADEFLQPERAIRAAELLGTREIWLNTGTFSSKYTNEPAKTVRHSPEERKVILDDIIGVANAIKKRGYAVAINLFSEDKSDTAEATDWSYLNHPGSAAALKDFLAQAYELDISVSLFDKAK